MSRVSSGGFELRLVPTELRVLESRGTPTLAGTRGAHDAITMRLNLFLVLSGVAIFGCSAGESSPIGAAELAAAHCASLPRCPIGGLDWALVDRSDREVCEARMQPLFYDELRYDDQERARVCLGALERTCPMDWWYRTGGHDWLLPECVPLRVVDDRPAGEACLDGGQCADGLSCIRDGGRCGSREGTCGESTEPGVLTDLWVEGASSCSNFGCDEVVYGNLNVAEGELCGVVDLFRHVCAPGLACVLEGDDPRCARPAREGEACTDELACGRGLFCHEGRCQAPTLGATVGAPCAGYDEIETCDVRLGLACVDVGPEGPRCGRATEVGDRCRWDVPTCGEGLWCGGETRCERASTCG
ncbi:MAG: hypothetical protein H6722_02155 [Sandaracinus sp.]|nr:hypothetical protein [Sandaracinus sp.]